MRSTQTSWFSLQTCSAQVMPTSAAVTIPASKSIKSNKPWCLTFPHLRRTPISGQPKPYQVPAKNIWNLPGPLLLSYFKLSSSLKPYWSPCFHPCPSSHFLPKSQNDFFQKSKIHLCPAQDLPAVSIRT